MSPTPRLRFVEREVTHDRDTNGKYYPKGIVRRERVRILQQLWVGKDTAKSKWRDVPLEAE